MRQLIGYLRLMRPANIVTAVSDVLAGAAISGYFSNPEWNEYKSSSLLWLILSTIGLYGGGVVFNDVFDAELDKRERPERPIPSGLIKKEKAAALGSCLLVSGVVATFPVHSFVWSLSAAITICIAAAALIYDKWGKHQPILGPLNMGLCRGLNLLLGMSIIPQALLQNWMLAIIPLVYIAAITMISRGEVHGGSRKNLYGALFLYAVVITCLLSFSFTKNTFIYTVPFIGLLAAFILPPLFKAVASPTGKAIGKAVKWGVLSLIVLNAGWAAATGAVYMACLMLLLLPLSLLLAKAFAVT
jgi:4-hydroxybenzoate polyprenyltransferase